MNRCRKWPLGVAEVPLLADDYYIDVRRSGASWEWEIQRRSKPLGVRWGGSGFVSRAGAKLAGEKALREFLAELVKQSAT
jgi:hypothetical protein